MHSTLREDPGDAREGLSGGVRDATPTFGFRPADPIVEWLRAGPERFPYNDPTHHPRRFVRHAVVVIDPGYGECDVEMVAWIHEDSRIPGYCTLRYSEWMMVVP